MSRHSAANKKRIAVEKKSKGVRKLVRTVWIKVYNLIQFTTVTWKHSTACKDIYRNIATLGLSIYP